MSMRMATIHLPLSVASSGTMNVPDKISQSSEGTLFGEWVIGACVVGFIFIFGMNEFREG